MSGPAAPAWTTERARLAGLRRCRPADDPVVLEARRDLRAAKLAAYIERCVAEAPPLTDEQRDLLVLLLRPAAGAA